jgi:hypothetical protein
MRCRSVQGVERIRTHAFLWGIARLRPFPWLPKTRSPPSRYWLKDRIRPVNPSFPVKHLE